MTPIRLVLPLSIALSTSCHSARHSREPGPAPDPEGTYRILSVDPLPGLSGAVSEYTALELARHGGKGRWEFRCVSHLSPEQLRVPGDTPHTSGRSLFELTEEELTALRVHLHERDGRVVGLSYSTRSAVDPAREARLPDLLRIRSGARGFWVRMDTTDEVGGPAAGHGMELAPDD